MMFRCFVAVLTAMGLSGAAAAQPEAAPIRLALIEGLSGPFANAGEAVDRNLRIAIEGVNARGGV
jgi:branched-chain amino acid transport system substrate-binding protein